MASELARLPGRTKSPNKAAAARANGAKGAKGGRPRKTAVRPVYKPAALVISGDACAEVLLDVALVDFGRRGETDPWRVPEKFSSRGVRRDCRERRP